MKDKWAITRQRGRGATLWLLEQACMQAGWCECVVAVHSEYEELQVSDSCILFVCVCFLGSHLWHMEVPRLGIELDLSQPQQRGIRALSVTCTTVHGSAGGSLTH